MYIKLINLLKKSLRIKNSPKKFIVPGNPKLETIKKKKKIENRGITCTKPLKYLIFLVCNRLYKTPIQKKRPAEARPCENISTILPVIECTSNENNPKTHKFI